MFCTGGIRCEKAGPFMESVGFESVFQLDGGILKYFEECGGAHYDGECFVFDQRVGLDPNLHESGSTQCFACQSPLTAAEQAHEHYVPGVSCPYCYKTPAEHLAATLERRHEQIRNLTRELPGSQPSDHHKPITIPASSAGKSLLDALCSMFEHIPEEVWRERFDSQRLLNAEQVPVSDSQVVQPGERYLHKIPAVIEPDVNMRVQVLHEDEALIVLNKPAPLPMHPGGRFFRNTLQHVLDAVYAPQKPRPSHRLDANTTGVVVVARTRHFAGQIQPQFARGEVEKVYLARVQGHPQADEFQCDAPISTEAGRLGSRTVDSDSGLAARTDFRVLERSSDGTALLEARPLTGRTNQIRIHLAHLGLPVTGDPAYLTGHGLGESQTLPVDAPPLCLHAWKIRFRHPLTRQFVSYTAAPPPWAATAASVTRRTPHEAERVPKVDADTQ